MKPLYALFLLSALAHAQPSLTIYNQNFAVVRQQVPLELEDGETTVSFDKVTSQLEPDSVVFRDPSGKLEFQILEQNYRNDPVSKSLLLHHFEGKEIPFMITEPNTEPYEEFGEIIRSGYVPGGREQTPIIKINDQIRFGLPGQPFFPSLGDDSILRPTLSWTLNSTTGSGEAELSYLSKGFDWKADYNLVISESSEPASINGWITLTNNSGTKFENAEVQLLAGDVNKIEEYGDGFGLAEADSFASSPRMAKQKTVIQKELDSYHLYSVARPVTLRDKETKQVQFMESAKVQASKEYVYQPLRHQRFWGHPNVNKGQIDGFPKDVSIFWRFSNTEENGLGIPLPAGKIRLYKDKDKKLEFLGENTIDHTPQKEGVEFYTGNAFDLVGERKILDFKASNNKTERNPYIIEKIEIKLRNRSKERATIYTNENLFRWSEWNVTEKSEDYEKLDAHTIRFTADLAPNEEKVITYTVKYTW